MNHFSNKVGPKQYLDQGLIQYFLLIECSSIQFVYSASYFDNARDTELGCTWRQNNILKQATYIEEEQTTQWSKEKVQKDKQRSTKHTYKTKDRVKRTPFKTGGELMCPGIVSSSCSTN